MVTAICMNNIRRRGTGVSAMRPKVTSRIPKATGMSEVGNLWPVRRKLAPPRIMRRTPKRTVTFAIRGGRLRKAHPDFLLRPAGEDYVWDSPRREFHTAHQRHSSRREIRV